MRPAIRVHSRAMRMMGVSSECELSGHLGIGSPIGNPDKGHRRLMSALADHVQELYLNVHAGLDVQHMAVDDGANSVAAGDEALPLQRGQNVHAACG